MSEESATATKVSLENFEWDTDGSSDFFGIEGTAVDPVEEIIEQVKPENDASTEESQIEDEEQEEEKEEEHKFFSEEEDDVLESKEPNYNEWVSKLKNKGILQNVELEEGEEIEEDKLLDLHNEEIELRVDETIEGFFEELDEDGASFLKHKRAGGSTEEFFKVYRKATLMPKGDLENEGYQERITRYYLNNIEEMDSEDIDERVEYLKESGKLKKYSEKYHQKSLDKEKTDKESLLKKSKDNQKIVEDRKKLFNDTVLDTLQETDEVGSFKFSEREKKKLYGLITKRTVKVGKNRYMTGLEKKLSDALSNPKKLIVLAKILQDDFDMSDIEEQTVTKQTRKVKRGIIDKKDARPRSSGIISKPKRSLADIDI